MPPRLRRHITIARLIVWMLPLVLVASVLPMSTPIAMTQTALAQSANLSLAFPTRRQIAPTGSVAIGDVTEDGVMDYLNKGVDGDGNNAIVVLPNPGTTGGAPIPIADSGGASFIAIGDLDGDGDSDLATAGARTAVFLNDGSGRFAQRIALPGSSTDVALGDIDIDGDLDLVVGRSDNTSAVYLNGVDGDSRTFTEADRFAQTISSAGAKMIEVGNIDADPALEIVVGHDDNMLIGYNYQLIGYQGATVRAWTPAYVFYPPGSPSFQYVALGDINGNGILDVVGINSPPCTFCGSYTTVFFDDGTKQNLSTGEGYSSALALGDLDSDGDLDLIQTGVIGRGYNNIFGPFLWNHTNGYFELGPNPFTLKEQVNDVAIADMNGDGSLDILSEGAILFNNQAFTDPTQPSGCVYNRDTCESGLTASATGDINSDGSLGWVSLRRRGPGAGGPNLIQFNYDPITKSWRDGSPIFGIEEEDRVGARFADMDGDQDLDLVVCSSLSGGSGTGSFTWGHNDVRLKIYYQSPREPSGLLDFSSKTLPVGSCAPHPASMEIGDLDNDGDLDLIGRNVYFNEGATFRTAQEFGRGGLALGDLDGDSDLDLVRGDGSYRNAGNGTFAELMPGDFGPSLALADMDADGDLDLIGRDPTSSNVAIYDNNGLGRFPSKRVLDISESLVAAGDINGDGLPDIVAVSKAGEGRVLMNIGGGNVNLRGAFTSRTFPLSIQLADHNADGSLDISVGGAYFDNWYLNPFGRASGHVNNPPIVRQVGLGSSLGAPGYALPVVQSGPYIPIRYVLADPEGDKVPWVRIEYSLDGGGLWLPAKGATGTSTTNLAAPPEGTRHVFIWDVYKSGVFGRNDNVVVRVVAATDGADSGSTVGRTVQSRAVSVSNPYRVQGAHVRVVRPGNIPAPNASVYRLLPGQTRGTALAGRDLVAFRTDAQGYLPGRGALNTGDRLVALQPVYSSTTGESSGYTLYYTSAPTTTTGLNASTITELGVHTLTVRPEHPLILFHLKVSLEWDARADTVYMSQLRSDLQRTSELLYRWSDGQIALGNITIYHEREQWDSADVRIFATNRLRPNANLGGIVTEPVTETLSVGAGSRTIIYEPGQIRMGTVWSRHGGSTTDAGGGEDWARALGHEIGHYALFLDENYLGLDDANRLVTIESCPSPMADVYRDDHGKFHPDAGWLPRCASTLSNRNTGRSDWRTIKERYDRADFGFALNMPPRYDAESGPNLLPLTLTTITEAPSAAARAFPTTLYSLEATNGGVYNTTGGARAFRFTCATTPCELGSASPSDRIVDLGQPGADELLAQGIRLGDRLCVYDTGASSLGCEQVRAGDTRLVVGSLDSRPWQPNVLVTPVTSRTLNLTVTNLPAGLSLRARLYPLNGPTPAPQPLTVTSTGYAAELTAEEPVLSAFVHLWVEEAASPRRELVVDFGLGGNPAKSKGTGKNKNTGKGKKAPALSPDGQVVLFGDALEFASGTYYSIQGLANLPAAALPWTTPVGQGYRLIASAGAPNLSQASISMGYYDDDVPAGTEAGLALYYLADGAQGWERLATTLDTEHNEAVATARGPGSYVLMTSLNLVAGWNMLSYPWPERTMAISNAMKLVNGTTSFQTIYGYDEQDLVDPWAVYAVDVPSYVNDLEAVEYGEGYWVYATKGAAAVRRLQLSEQGVLAGMPYPPATYYTTQLSNQRFSLEAGQQVQAFVDGALCAEAETREVQDGQQSFVAFVIDVPAATEAAPDCGMPGRNVTFTVDGTPYNVTLRWENSHPHSLDVQRNAVYLPLVARSLPANTVDLKVLGVEIVPAVPVAGRPAEVRVTVTNSGTQPIARSFWVDLYLDPETPPQAGDIWPDLSEFGATWRVYGLGVGETVVLSTLRPDDPLAPGATYSNFRGFGSAGQHELYVRADTFGPDGAGTIDEGDEENNLLGPRTVAVRAE